jgi:hypothetical protein
VQPATIAISAGCLRKTDYDGTISRIDSASSRAVCLLLGDSRSDDPVQVLRMNARTGAVEARIRAGRGTGVTVGDGLGSPAPGRVAIQSAYIHLPTEN